MTKVKGKITPKQSIREQLPANDSKIYFFHLTQVYSLIGLQKLKQQKKERMLVRKKASLELKIENYKTNCHEIKIQEKN